MRNKHDQIIKVNGSSKQKNVKMYIFRELEGKVFQRLFDLEELRTNIRVTKEECKNICLRRLEFERGLLQPNLKFLFFKCFMFRI